MKKKCTAICSLILPVNNLFIMAYSRDQATKGLNGK